MNRRPHSLNSKQSHVKTKNTNQLIESSELIKHKSPKIFQDKSYTTNKVIKKKSETTKLKLPPINVKRTIQPNNNNSPIVNGDSSSSPVYHPIFTEPSKSIGYSNVTHKKNLHQLGIGNTATTTIHTCNEHQKASPLLLSNTNEINKRTSKLSINAFKLSSTSKPFNTHHYHHHIEMNSPSNNSNKTKTSFTPMSTFISKYPRKRSVDVPSTNLNPPLTTLNDFDVYDGLKPLHSSKTKHAFQTQTGRNETGQTKPNNQDSILICESLFNLDNVSIFAVMDGHGANGHFVSDYVKNAIATHFTNKDTYSNEQSPTITSELIQYKLSTKKHHAITSFFNNLNHDLQRKAKFDVHFSGTTCVCVFQLHKKIICSNIGDSRAIVIYCDSKSKYYCEPLSNDHKPNLPHEKSRIESKGGVVSPCDDEKDFEDCIQRVWVKGENFPGIAISRTLGDSVAHSVGVNSHAEIIEKDINGNMCAIVLASDGVWEFLSNDEVTNIVVKYYIRNDPQGAVGEIVKKASDKWKEEGDAMDDITCIVNFIKMKHIKKTTI